MKDPGALERGNRQSNLVDEHHFVRARVEEVVCKPAQLAPHGASAGVGRRRAQLPAGSEQNRALRLVMPPRP
jgi:hypothetical protein